MELSRRRFAQAAGSAALAGPPLAARENPLTAQEIVERIQKNAGVPWNPAGADTIKAGDPATEVTGIATTAMATLNVLARAAKEKSNFVVTLEPVFFGGRDAPPADDPIFAAKQEFIRKNGLVVWRFNDHWRARKPDPLAAGLGRALDWSRHQVRDDPARYELPGTPLGSLVDDMARRLHARAGIRVVGDRETRVRRVVVLPGVSPLATALKMLPECDLLVAGETREWESVEYAQDTVASGQKKGLIMLGRVLSEEPGMDLCAEWLKTVVPEVPVRWLPAGDPYWRPA